MEIGCNIGREVITQSGESIHIVTWDKDSVCGIYNNMHNFTGAQCIANGKHGNVIEYSQNDINCNLPLDSFLLVGFMAVFGYTIIKMKMI
jgi:hypothetical protein